MKANTKKAWLGGLVSNPVFVLVLGTCPTITVSYNIQNAFFLGVATMFVLFFSNIMISALRKVIPDKVRLPVYIVIIAAFVSLVEIVVKSEFVYNTLPWLNESLGGMISLIVVNCIILGRAESFASKNTVGASAIDGLSMGLGFIAAITLMGAVRQFLIEVCQMELFSRTAGGFLVFGLLLAAFNGVYAAVNKAIAKKNRKVLLPAGGEVVHD